MDILPRDRHEIFPKIISIGLTFEFYIYAEAQGGLKFFSPVLKLTINDCRPESNILSAPSIIEPTMGFNHLVIDYKENYFIYILDSFKVSNIYCPIIDYELANVLG